MDIPNLQAFVSVAENHSFSTASEQLFLTQPAISKRIAALEEELQCALFDRIGRQVNLTEAGRVLLPQANSILLTLEDSVRLINNLSGETKGQLRIGTSHHIGLHRLPPVLRQYAKDFPNVDLDIHFMDSEEACYAVEHGNLELAIVTLPLKPSKVLSTENIWSDPLSVIVNKTHPLAKTKSCSLTQLASHKAVLPSRGTYTREIIETAFIKSKIDIKISMATNYLETIKMLVSVGLGWSILPESMLTKELRKVDIKQFQLTRELGMVWHGSRTLSNAALALQRCVRDF